MAWPVLARPGFRGVGRMARVAVRIQDARSCLSLDRLLTGGVAAGLLLRLTRRGQQRACLAKSVPGVWMIEHPQGHRPGQDRRSPKREWCQRIAARPLRRLDQQPNHAIRLVERLRAALMQAKRTRAGLSTLRYGLPQQARFRELGRLPIPQKLLREAVAAGLLKRFDQRFGHRIGLAEQLQDALMIKRRQLAVLTPLQRSAVELINLEGPALRHGKERHNGPPTATIERP